MGFMVMKQRPDLAVSCDFSTRNGIKKELKRKTTDCLWALTLLTFISPPVAAAKQGQVPQFDIARTCREARAFAVNEKDLAYRGCMSDEKEARQQLARKWQQFKPQDRNDCVAQGAAPIPSYVELLTCLEMSEEAGALLKPNRGARESSPGAAVGAGPKPTETPPAPAPSETGAPPAVPEAGGEIKPDPGRIQRPEAGGDKEQEPGGEKSPD